MKQKPSIIKRILNRLTPKTLEAYLKEQNIPRNKGYCVICEEEVTFYERGPYLRNTYQCDKCLSIPRHRALVNALNTFYPKWKDLKIHESSPGGPVSKYLQEKCAGYSGSHYFEDVPRGESKNGFRSEDLSAMTFDDASFDLFITSDVFEHVMEPEKAFAEIARILKPNGAHLFTMPWYPELDKSLQRAKLENNKIVLLEKAVYHGNPISNEGSLVAYDWGKDFCGFVLKNSGMYTTIYLMENKTLGLKAQLMEVFISVKP